MDDPRAINTPAKPTLLVIEDNAVIYTMISKSISVRRGGSVQILSASNGKAGLEAALKQRPDLILLDWLMPEYSGEYFLKEQAQAPSIAEVPVLVYSALNEEKLKETVKAFPAVKSFIRKPLIPSKLYEIISPYLKQRTWSRDQAKA
jgi:CheY-like chemotaxis protein